MVQIDVINMEGQMRESEHPPPKITQSGGGGEGGEGNFKGFKLPNDGNLPPLTKEELSSWIARKKESIRPWGTFFAMSRFRSPIKSANGLSRRILQNVEYFQSNYFVVFIGLLIYCLVTSPLLLFAFGIVLGAFYYIFTKNNLTDPSQQPSTLLGKISIAKQCGLVGFCSIPLLYIVGAGGVLFWVLGVSCSLIMAHALFYDVESLLQSQDQEDLSFESKVENVV